MNHRPSLAVLVFLLSSVALMAADESAPARTKAAKPEKVTTEGGAATPGELLTTLPGFKSELLRSAQIGEDSWIAMTMDGKGRLIISPQSDRPMLRMTLDAGGQFAMVEPICGQNHREKIRLEDALCVECVTDASGAGECPERSRDPRPHRRPRIRRLRRERGISEIEGTYPTAP